MLNELRPHFTRPMPDGIARVNIPAEKQVTDVVLVSVWKIRTASDRLGTCKFDV